jgi:hypothetical protein
MTPLEYKIFLLILLVATLCDLVIPVIIGLQYPRYNHLYDPISALGTDGSPVQKYQCWNLIIVGFLLMLFVTGQYRLFESLRWCHILYIAGIVLYGLGTVVAGFFPEDPVGVDETVSGKIHGIASGIGFIFLILNPLWAVWIREFKGVGPIHGIALVLALATFALFILSENRHTGVFKYTGLWQRLNLVVLYGYLVFNFMRSRAGIP